MLQLPTERPDRAVEYEATTQAAKLLLLKELRT
jgi:hypothetical protein